MTVRFRGRRVCRLLLGGAVALAGAWVAACSSGGTATPRDDSPSAFVFESRCASCHTPGGPGKDTAVMDLADAREVILQGRVDKGMPAFAGVLTNPQVDDMVEWLGRQQGVPMPTVTPATGPDAR